MQKGDQIDACVIVEMSVQHTKTGKRNNQYKKVREYFYQIEKQRKNGFISLSCLGEVFNAIHRIKDSEQRSTAFSEIDDILSREGFKINALTKETLLIVNRIIEFDHFIEAQDALRIAEAITHNHQLITTDEKMIENEKLQQEFNIAIKGPY